MRKASQRRQQSLQQNRQASQYDTSPSNYCKRASFVFCLASSICGGICVSPERGTARLSVRSFCRVPGDSIDADAGKRPTQSERFSLPESVCQYQIYPSDYPTDSDDEVICRRTETPHL